MDKQIEIAKKQMIKLVIFMWVVTILNVVLFFLTT